jgi:hypothetical protein
MGRASAGGGGAALRSGVTLAAYCLVSFLFFGLQVAAEPGDTQVGRTTDPNIFTWAFAWWPHAILSGENPIHTDAIWAPVGYNLAWGTSVPGLALAFAPLTLLAGPVVAYNVAAVLLPALAGWTAFLLCRYLTGAFWPSLAGGYLFGFSSYMLGHVAAGHMNLTAVFPMPLIALAILRYLDGALDRRALVLRLGILIAAQFSFSTELVATMTLALAVAVALAFACVPDARASLRSLLAPIAAGYAVAAVLVSPLLYYALSDFQSGAFHSPNTRSTDVANLVVPTGTIALGGDWASGIAERFPDNEFEQGAYLSLPLLTILALFAFPRRRQPGVRWLALAFAAAVVASLGAALYVAGTKVVVLPWRLLTGLPLFDTLLPMRLMLYATLVAIVVAALWAASNRTPAWLRTGLVGLAAVALFPNLGADRWSREPEVPAFFADGMYERCFEEGENVLVIPYGYLGNSLLWQARSDFHFRMPGGEFSPLHGKGFTSTTVVRLLHNSVRLADGATILQFADTYGVGAVVLDPNDDWPWQQVLEPLGKPMALGGILLYPLGSAEAMSIGCRAQRL